MTTAELMSHLQEAVAQHDEAPEGIEFWRWLVTRRAWADPGAWVPVREVIIFAPGDCGEPRAIETVQIPAHLDVVVQGSTFPVGWDDENRIVVVYALGDE